MVLLESSARESNFSCPDFTLNSVEDKTYKLADFSNSKALLVAFICNHCPYVKAIENRIINLRKNFSPRDLSIVAICSNDADKYPDDSKEKLYERWLKLNYDFPYLIDNDQTIAKAFDAVCTPDFFLFDQQRKLFYRGQLDNNWQHEEQVTRHDLVQALKALLAGKEAPLEQIPSRGCSIKWKL
jgi:peroxiredoxin